MKKDVVLNEIVKELSWKEKIIVKMLKIIFIKIYKKGIEKGFNSVI